MLISYYLMVQHYENLVTMFMPKEYWDKKDEIFHNIPSISSTWKDIHKNLIFFQKVSDWFQLLHIFSYNEGILKITRPYKEEEAGPTWLNGYNPETD